MELHHIFQDGLSDGPDETPKISRDGEIENLRAALSALQMANQFSVGDIVSQKPGCRLYRDISDNGLAIVVELLPSPMPANDGQDAASHCFRQTVDMVIGQWTLDGSFILHHVDSRRYEVVSDE